MTLTPNGRLLFTTNLENNELGIFRIDRETGQPDYLGSEVDGVDGVDGLYLVRWADVSKDGKHVYVAGMRAGKIAVFAIEGPSCDFDRDLACDTYDIDQLVAEIVAETNNRDFDLTGDGVVDLDDITDPVDGWLSRAGEENLGPGLAFSDR